MKKLTTSFLLLMTLFVFSHEVTAQTKAYKRWIYLDKNWNPIVDTSNYSYKRLTLIDGETNIRPLGNFDDNYLLKREIDSTVSKNDKILDGKYTWYDSNGNKVWEYVFENGESVSYREFRKKGQVKTYFDFTTHAENDPLSYYVYVYNKSSTKLEVSCIQKDEKGNWPRMR